MGCQQRVRSATLAAMKGEKPRMLIVSPMEMSLTGALTASPEENVKMAVVEFEWNFRN